VVYDLINVIQDGAKLTQALIKDKQCENLFILAASQTRDKEALTQDGVEKVLDDLAEMGFDYIVCDSPAGIETGALMAMHLRRRGRGGDQPRGQLGARLRPHPGHAQQQDQRAIEGREPIKEHLLITRYNPNRVEGGQMLSLERHPRHPAHQADRRDPRERGGAAGQSNQGVPAIHEGQRCGRGLPRRDRPLPGRGQADAFHRGREAGLLQAPRVALTKASRSAGVSW
jgi:septum site-determining protein MinD